MMKRLTKRLIILIAMIAISCTGLNLTTSPAHAISGSGFDGTLDLGVSLMLVSQLIIMAVISGKALRKAGTNPTQLNVPLRDGTNIQVYMKQGKMTGYIRNYGPGPR